jgi:hypothetical protein
MKKFLVLAALLVLPVPALAQRIGSLPSVAPSSGINSGIAAVVNDSVITTFDLEQRMKLADAVVGIARQRRRARAFVAANPA